MAYNLKFVLLTIKGTMGSPSTEGWACTFKIAPLPATSVVPLLPAFLAAVKPAIVTFHNSTDVAAGTDAFLTEITAAEVDVDGRYTGGGTQATTSNLVSPPDGGTGAALLPWSTACCYTLTTDRVRGRGARGRFYYPATGLAMTGTGGLWTTTTAANRAAAARTMILAINAAANPAFTSTARVQVLSSIGAGVNEGVRGVKVGRKPDRQERREGTLAEDYQASSPI